MLAAVHRLEMVLGWDLVIVMDGGRIVEVGVPEKLASENGSVFKGLWDSQHGGWSG